MVLLTFGIMRLVLLGVLCFGLFNALPPEQTQRTLLVLILINVCVVECRIAEKGRQ